ncbi:MAG: DUF6916 family protein [Solirubrobacteraceae bacterium]
MSESFTLETFAGLLDERFRLRPDDGDPVDLLLADATKAGDPFLSGGRAPFSLLFRGPPAPILPQRIYALEHPALGAFELFLVPLQPDAAGTLYQAVFT